MINKFGDKTELINVTHTECLNQTLPWKPTCTRCGYCKDFVYNLKYRDGYVEQVCEDCILEEEIDDIIKCIIGWIN